MNIRVFLSIEEELITASAIVGVVAVSEKLAKEAEEENTSLFFAQMFDRQLSRGRMMLEAFVVRFATLSLE